MSAGVRLPGSVLLDIGTYKKEASTACLQIFRFADPRLERQK